MNDPNPEKKRKIKCVRTVKNHIILQQPLHMPPVSPISAIPDEIVLADSIARYKRAKGYDVFFQTGTDEHGQKIEEKAEAAGVTPQEFVDRSAGEIRRIWDLMNTS